MSPGRNSWLSLRGKVPPALDISKTYCRIKKVVALSRAGGDTGRFHTSESGVTAELDDAVLSAPAFFLARSAVVWLRKNILLSEGPGHTHPAVLHCVHDGASSSHCFVLEMPSIISRFPKVEVYICL